MEMGTWFTRDNGWWVVATGIGLTSKKGLLKRKAFGQTIGVMG